MSLPCLSDIKKIMSSSTYLLKLDPKLPTPFNNQLIGIYFSSKNFKKTVQQRKCEINLEWKNIQK
jgi:hypothetical protein